MLSDRAMNERRMDNEVRERLVRVETNGIAASTELSKVRDRVHTIADTQGALMLLAEDAKSDRDDMSRKIDKLDQKIDPLTVTQAQLATAFAMHSTQCAADKTEYAAAIKGLQRTVWTACGGVSVLWLGVTVVLALLKYH